MCGFCRTTRALRRNNVGFGSSWIRFPNEEISTRGWISGYFADGGDLPGPVLEWSVPRALRLVKRRLGELGPRMYRKALAGSWETTAALLRWCNMAAIGLTSAAARKAAAILCRLATKLPRVTALDPPLEGYCQEASSCGEDGRDFILVTKKRMFSEILPSAWNHWAASLLEFLGPRMGSGPA